MQQKTTKQFSCKVDLLRTLESMAQDNECSVDFLINEAIANYIQARNYAIVSNNDISLGDKPEAQNFISQTTQLSAQVLPHNIDGVSENKSSVAVPQSVFGNQVPSQQVEAMVSENALPTSQAPAVPSQIPPPPVLTDIQPPLYDGGVVPTPRPTLYVVFRNQKYPIQKDSFVIGRSMQDTDLMIQDNNVSRKHATVVFRDNAYSISDMGSTNGIEHNGVRIQHKNIEEGDTFYICVHEIRFTFL